jgi:HSP20 family protein
MTKTLPPWRPFRELSPFRRTPTDLFEHFFGDGNWPRFEGEEEWALTPAIETHLEGNVLTVKADLPGLDPKEVELTVEGKLLTINGERKTEEKHEEGKTYHREVRYGAFTRTVTLPAEVDAEKIEAHYENGVLKVKVPLPEEVVPKKVAIEVKPEEPEKAAEKAAA